MEKLDMTVINRTMDALRKNNMQPFFCEKKEDAAGLVAALMKKGDTVSHGGSVTLKETGITKLLSGGDYNYLDRSKEATAFDKIDELIDRNR